MFQDRKKIAENFKQQFQDIVINNCGYLQSGNENWYCLIFYKNDSKLYIRFYPEFIWIFLYRTQNGTYQSNGSKIVEYNTIEEATEGVNELINEM